MDSTKLDSRAFRDALGCFGTGVTIVTTQAPGSGPTGLTINSFSSVSIDPPLVLWSLRINSPCLPAFRESGHFAVHILSKDQRDLSVRFTRSSERFADLDWSRDALGNPVIKGSLARFACRTTTELTQGDHAVFIGEVLAFDRISHERPPLLYFGGTYRQLAMDSP